MMGCGIWWGCQAPQWESQKRKLLSGIFATLELMNICGTWTPWPGPQTTCWNRALQKWRFHWALGAFVPGNLRKNHEIRFFGPLLPQPPKKKPRRDSGMSHFKTSHIWTRWEYNQNLADVATQLAKPIMATWKKRWTWLIGVVSTLVFGLAEETVTSFCQWVKCIWFVWSDLIPCWGRVIPLTTSKTKYTHSLTVPAYLPPALHPKGREFEGELISIEPAWTTKIAPAILAMS